MLPDATELLSHIARQIYGWQRGAFANEITVGEEAITQFLNLEMCMFPDQIRVKQWAKKPESLTGADFDLTITNGQDSFCYAVQAKRLYRKSRKYDYLSRSKYTKQHSNLKNYADSVGAVPVYCLYNWAEEALVKNTWRYKTVGAEPSAEFGCTVSPLSVVNKFIEPLAKIK